MMFVVAHKDKKFAIIAACILLALTLWAGLFYSNDTVRLKTYDAYNSVFKLVITDRVLREDALVYSNIPYCNTDNPRQTLDLYIPKNPDRSPTPLVIFIHGGGWRAGDKSSQLMTYYAESLLKKDVAVASINYRLYPEVTYPGPNDDVSCAIAYIPTIANTYNIKKDGWTIFGDSAGAQLGAYVMSDSRVNAPLERFIGFYGPYDMTAQASPKDSNAYNYANEGVDAAQASPLFRAGRQGASYHLFHGVKDPLVSVQQSRDFADKLRLEQIDVTLTEVQNAGHYFSPRTNPSANKIKEQIIKNVTAP